MSKKDKHARNQAKYMERKREGGLEWLTEWVPEPAYQAFKAMAKAARKSHGVAGEAQLADAAALAARHQGEVPEWARGSDVLLAVWMASTVATAALDQAQAERDATKSRKAEAKAAKVGVAPAPAPVPADLDTEAVTDGTLEEPKAAPAKRVRKQRVTPAAPVEPVIE